MGDKKHSRFSPSQLARIIACPGSVSLSATLPGQKESSYAAEGTLLHNKMDKILTGVIDGLSFSEAFNAVKFDTTEQRNLCSDVTDNLLYYIPEIEDKGTRIYSELPVSMPSTFGEVYGTLDLAVVTNTAIHVVDFKFGAGVEVDVNANPQLLAYLTGFLRFLGRDAHEFECLYVWIFQPQRDNHALAQITIEDINDFTTTVQQTIKDALSATPTFNPGFEQCRWCPAGGMCEARAAQTQKDAALILAEYADTPNYSLADNDSLAKLLSLESKVLSAFKAIKAHLYTQLQQGHKVPGHKLVSGRSTRTWAPGVSGIHVAVTLGLSTNDCIECKMKSPAQIEKLVPNSQRDLFNKLIVTKEGTPVMVSEHNKKQEISLEAEKVFADFLD